MGSEELVKEKAKYGKALLAALVFAALLGVAYVATVKLLKVDVVFYSSLLAAAAATLATATILWRWRLFALFTTFEKLQLAAIFALTGYVFAISIPTVIDRSLSFYILEKLQQRGGGIRVDAFEYVFTNEYMREHRLVDVRLTEQVQSGTIVIAGNCVMLTDRGQRLATFGRFFRTNLLPKQRLLRGEYTDALTDPFRSSASHQDYACGAPDREVSPNPP